MDLSKVKMVVTDMDGTLLNSKSEVSKQFFELYQQLKDHGIRFVAASGRQFNSIEDKLKPISKDIIIVAENGGYIKSDEQELGSVFMSSTDVLRLIPHLRKNKDLYTVLCGKKTAYIETKDEKFIHILKEYYSQFKPVDDLTKILDDSFFKIAIYHFESSENYTYPHVKHLEDDLQIKISGSNWVDISDPRANKGHAVKMLQEKFNISKDQTMVFGDYNNDLEMINLAYYSFAMENAHINVKNAARFRTKSNNEGGVEFILNKLIRSKKTQANT